MSDTKQIYINIMPKIFQAPFITPGVADVSVKVEYRRVLSSCRCAISTRFIQSVYTQLKYKVKIVMTSC